MSKYHHGDLREALLAAARAAIETEGVAGLGLRKLAREVGVSHTAVYRHFANRDALLAAVAAEGFRALEAAHGKAMDHADPVLAFAGSGMAYVRFALENPALFGLMFRPGSLRDHPELAEAAHGSLHQMHGMVQQGQAAGGLVQGNAQTMALAAWCLAHGFARLSSDGALPDLDTDPQALAVQLSSVMLAGIGHPDAPSTAMARALLSKG